MRPGLQLAAFAGCALLAVPSVAEAGRLGIAGTYGNEEGCAAVAAGAELSGAAVVLRDDGLDEGNMRCTFTHVPPGSGMRLVTLSCEWDGKMDTPIYYISDPDGESGTITVLFGDGDPLYELGRCS